MIHYVGSQTKRKSNRNSETEFKIIVYLSRDDLRFRIGRRLRLQGSGKSSQDETRRRTRNVTVSERSSSSNATHPNATNTLHCPPSTVNERLILMILMLLGAYLFTRKRPRGLPEKVGHRRCNSVPGRSPSPGNRLMYPVGKHPERRHGECSMHTYSVGWPSDGS
jgi:hypothetical protein